jgi:hypothetical protein
MSMFPRCTSHTAGIGILMAWYGAFRRASRISALSTEHLTELARGRCLAGLYSADPPRSHQQHQHKGARRHRWQTPIQHCVLTWGEWAHNFRNLESESSNPGIEIISCSSPWRRLSTLHCRSFSLRAKRCSNARFWTRREYPQKTRAATTTRRRAAVSWTW